MNLINMDDFDINPREILGCISGGVERARSVKLHWVGVELVGFGVNINVLQS